jgi:hypothetical protein
LLLHPKRSDDRIAAQTAFIAAPHTHRSADHM